MAALLVVSCSDDDKPVAPTPQWGWSPLGSVIGAVFALTVYDNKLIAGGDFAEAGGTVVNFIAVWNGTSWSSFGSGMDNGVRALTVYGNKLIAGGYFSTAGGDSAASNIAAWGSK